MYGLTIRCVGSGGSGNDGKGFAEDVRLVPALRIDASQAGSVVEMGNGANSNGSSRRVPLRGACVILGLLALKKRGDNAFSICLPVGHVQAQHDRH